MNSARIAALLREQARIASELADAFEEDDSVVDRPSRPRVKGERRHRALTRPARRVSDHAAAQAARVLKERGFT